MQSDKTQDNKKPVDDRKAKEEKKVTTDKSQVEKMKTVGGDNKTSVKAK